MTDELVRFGVAMEAGLLSELDALVKSREATRSRLLSDLARAEVAKNQLKPGVSAVGALTLVYDHHVRDLTERLNELQHELGDSVRSSLHVHLNHDECLEVIVLRGQADLLQSIAARILAMRGVNHGELVLVPEQSEAAEPGEARRPPTHQSSFTDLERLPTHSHTHGHRAHKHALGTPEHAHAPAERRLAPPVDDKAGRAAPKPRTKAKNRSR